MMNSEIVWKISLRVKHIDYVYDDEDDNQENENENENENEDENNENKNEEENNNKNDEDYENLGNNEENNYNNYYEKRNYYNNNYNYRKHSYNAPKKNYYNNYNTYRPNYKKDGDELINEITGINVNNNYYNSKKKINKDANIVKDPKDLEPKKIITKNSNNNIVERKISLDFDKEVKKLDDLFD